MKNILFILLFCLSTILNAQKGNKYIKNYSPSDYKGSDQNRGAVQDKNGIMYFANLDGVLMFDGKYWKTIPINNTANVYSIDINDKNTIFVGGENQFGFFKTLSNGEIVYQSLSDSLNKHDLDFTKTWATVCIGEDVFFCSNEKLFCYRKNKLTAFSPDVDRFHTFFKVGKHLFIREREVGFKVYESNQLSFVDATEEFADKKVEAILHVTNNKYIVASKNGGFYYLYYNEQHPSQSKFIKAESELDSWISDNELYCGLEINSNYFALGSEKNGIKFIDSTLHELSAINSSSGLQDDAINYIFNDANNNLWVPLNKGISHIEINIPISYWQKPNGVEGVVESSIKFKGKLFISTDKGLKVLDEATNSFIVTEIRDASFILSTSQNHLFIPTDAGCYYFDGKIFHLLTDEYASYCSYYNDTNHLLYIGTEDGLLIFNPQLNFKLIKKFTNLHSVRSIAFDKDQNCALGTSDNGVFILKSNFSLNYISEKEGLPTLNETTVFSYFGKIYFGTDAGFYELSDDLEKAKFSKTLNQKKYSINRATQINNDIWYDYGTKDKFNEKIQKIAIISSYRNQFLFSNSYLNRIQNTSAKHFYQDSNSVYISTNQGLYQYELKDFVKPKKLNIILSRVWFGSDTINYLENYSSDISIEPTSFNFNKNELHIKASVTSYYESNKIEFSYYLEGSESNFKDWTSDATINYNSLPEGNYVFHIKGKDIFENETSELTFAFSIQPPWYRSIIAYVSYVLLLIIAIFVFVKLYTKRLKDQNIQLEGIVAQRTETIVEQKRLVEHKHKEITDSINYAERIQRTFLATNDLLNQHLQNYFILFKPKDVVSGDFYWAETLTNGNFVLATADSTGHGVPGAIMSLLNITSLEKAIEHLTNPADILNHTRQTIIKRLKRDGSEEGGKDGMDCTLIVFDFNNKQLHVAAANNPVWIVRDSELIEIKPDKMPVGKHDRDQEAFTAHTLDIKEGDIIYTLTDGFPDQFGGEKGKKFMSKNLKELLATNSKLPMSEQKELLNRTFTNWVGELEQVDDVTLIGIKI